jgi:hypothetical protein
MLAFAKEKDALPPLEGLLDVVLDKNVIQALEWSQSLTKEQVMARREEAVRRVEQRAEWLVQTGKAKKWLRSADKRIRKVSRGVNGPLLEELATLTGFGDASCVQAFREGAPILGPLPAADSAVEHQYPAAESTEMLAKTCLERNKALLASLKQDKHQEFLMEQTLSDADCGRMTKPVPLELLDLSGILLARRFSREQGVKPNGEVKLRAVDDLTANGVNAAAQASGKNTCDSIDMLAKCAVMIKTSGRRPAFWKADIDAAFRRIPLKADQSWAAGVAFMHNGVAMAAKHHALMFGSLGSVHGWDRQGALLCHLGRRILGLPLFRYVDDFFGAEEEGLEDHAMQCFARLVRAVLGPTAIKQEKLECGTQLEVLGLSVSYDNQGLRVRVSDKKAEAWSECIQEVLDAGVLSSGLASKLAGRLSFAAQHTFRRAGRAALRPLFRQQYAPLQGSRLGGELRLSLQWWLHALGCWQAQVIPWDLRMQKATLLTDARSTPPRVAAVLLWEGQIHYTDWEPDQDILDAFTERKDNQIMGLELLGIALGLCTFGEMLRNRSVRIYCDNVGGERAMQAGAARAEDHNRLVHAMWMATMKLNLAVWIDRVPTKENIADLPSREAYELLEKVGCG